MTTATRVALPVSGGGPISFDHAVIAVPDLPAAMAELERTGFAVAYGGRHRAHGTHNAVVLLDGGYLELISLEEPSAAPRSPLAADVGATAADGGGLVGYALAIDDGPDAQRLVAATRVNGGFPDPLVMERLDRGRRLHWELRFAEREGFLGPYPFFIRWTTPAPYDGGGRPPHSNGVMAVSAIEVLIASEAERAVGWYRDALGPAMGAAVDVADAAEPGPAHGGRLAGITLRGGWGRSGRLALDPELFGDTTLRLE